MDVSSLLTVVVVLDLVLQGVRSRVCHRCFSSVAVLPQLIRKRTRALEDVIDGHPLNCIQSELNTLSRYKDVHGLAQLTRKRTRALEDVIDGRPLNCIQSDLNIMQNTFS